jgi:hypothetical protein
MMCESVLELISLYYYGELSPDEEDQVEAHMHECAACAGEMERQRRLAAALDGRAIAVPAALLQDCRADLMAAIQGGAPGIARLEKGPWTLFLEAMGATFGRLRMPVGATALIALGFVGAKLTPNLQIGHGGIASASLAPEDALATVRSVQPDSSGRVQIAYDETRRKVVSGRMDDAAIQKLLLTAAHEQNPTVRWESVDVLKDRAESDGVRDVLLNLVANDSNAQVRLKALEGLKPLAGDAEVRKTLSQVLLSDDNDAVRMRAVDLLVAHRDDSMAGILQHLMQREDNGYVRQKCEKALKEMNASLGTF